MADANLQTKPNTVRKTVIKLPTALPTDLHDLPANVQIALREASRARRMLRDASHALCSIPANRRLEAMAHYRRLQHAAGTIARTAAAELGRHRASVDILIDLDAIDVAPPQNNAAS